MKFNHTWHKKLWGYLAEKGIAYKAEAVRKIGLSSMLHNCSACEYARDKWLENGAKGQSFKRCEYCPLEGMEDCAYSSAPFYRWLDAESLKERKRCAAVIRDMPVKKGIETI